VLLSLPGIEMTLATDVGVFGRSRVDRGTKTLLRTAPAPTAGLAAVDLGCGYGPIALAMAVLAATSTVWGVDVNRRALDLTSQNAKSHGIANVEICLPDDVPDAARFPLPYSNLPIKVGKDALHQSAECSRPTSTR
jgi:16S rRNA G1207 methylase RsmC